MNEKLISKIMEEQKYLNESTVEDLLSFIQGQIDEPMISNEDYLEALLDKIDGKATKAMICRSILESICEEHDYIRLIIDEDTDDIVSITKAVYKFFIKNRSTLIFKFLKAFLLKGKTRKEAVDGMDCPSGYSRVHHGKKEYYIIIMKTIKVIKNITRLDMDHSKFIKTLVKSGYNKSYVLYIETLIDEGTLTVDSLAYNYINILFDSDNQHKIVTKLQASINTDLIQPMIEPDNIKLTLVIEKDIEDIDVEADDTDHREYID